MVEISPLGAAPQLGEIYGFVISSCPFQRPIELTTEPILIVNGSNITVCSNDVTFVRHWGYPSQTEKLE